MKLGYRPIYEILVAKCSNVASVATLSILCSEIATLGHHSTLHFFDQIAKCSRKKPVFVYLLQLLQLLQFYETSPLAALRRYCCATLAATCCYTCEFEPEVRCNHGR